MKHALPIVGLVLPVLSGCHIFMGFVAMQGGAQETIVGRANTIEHCNAFLKRGQALMYCGSDKQWHYFLSRPIDDSAFYKITATNFNWKTSGRSRASITHLLTPSIFATGSRSWRGRRHRLKNRTKLCIRRS